MSLKKRQVPKFSKASGFALAPIPPELADLNEVELRMIGLGVCFTTCYNIGGRGQECSSGHSISFWNDAHSIVASLPRTLDQCGVVRLSFRGGPNDPVFIARPNMLRRALHWLRAHNPLNQGIEISEDVLASLEMVHGSGEEPNLVDEADLDFRRENVNDDDVTATVEDTFNLPTSFSNDQTESDAVAAFFTSSMGSVPSVEVQNPTVTMNEYKSKMMMQCCFPSPFPDARGGINPIDGEVRVHKYELADYCAHLMRWHDRRFVIHRRFKFFCLNVMQRRQIEGLTQWIPAGRVDNCNASAENDDGDIDMSSSGATTECAMKILKTLKPYFRSVRGSGLYWSGVRDESMGMLGNAALPNPWPTFFFTLSAADMIWPEFFKACQPSLSLDAARSLPKHERQRLLVENPDIACQYFYRRFKVFFNKVMCGKDRPLGKVSDYFWRVEFQRRGSPHIHGLLWVEDAPDVLKLSGTEDGRKILSAFADEHISAESLQFDLDRHCCTDHDLPQGVDILALRPPGQKNEVCDKVDLARVVARVQQHACYEGSTYRKKTADCRFGFPKTLRKETTIEVGKSSRGSTKIEVRWKRDDPWTNYYNPTLLRLWRANMDLKFIGNAYGAAEYTAAYVSKSEPDTNHFRTTITKALAQCSSTAQQLTMLRKVANASIAVREVSAQEALWILLNQIPMHAKSRNVLKVKSCRHASRFHRVEHADCLHEIETDGVCVDMHPKLDKLEQAYCARPLDEPFANMCYREFCENFEQVSDGPSPNQQLQRWEGSDGRGFIKARRSKQAIMKSPRMKPDCTNPEYCFSEVLLLTSWRKMSDLPSSDEECFRRFEQLQSKASLEAIEREVELGLQKEQGSMECNLQFEQPDWQLCETLQPSYETDLEKQPILDRPSTKDKYSSTDALRALNFVRDELKSFAKRQPLTTANNAHTGNGTRKRYTYPVQEMTADQWIPFAICMNQCRKRYLAASPHESCPPLRLVLNGEGGSGKSWLIRDIVKDVHEIFGESHCSVRYSRRVLLMAHHGAAAFNIKGTTICSALAIPPLRGAGYGGKYKRLQSTKSGLKRLRQLQDDYRDVHMVVIDEFSVISCAMLHWIDQRMREIWPSCKDAPFGGRDLILSGDLGQLNPVTPYALYTPAACMDNANQVSGRVTWCSIPYVCSLSSQNRGKEDPDWYEALRRLRKMDQSSADLELFNSRFLGDTSAFSRLIHQHGEEVAQCVNFRRIPCPCSRSESHESVQQACVSITTR